ncbi:MAG: DUF986 family protein [Anaerohalosphaeraceae bacterium]
MSIEAPLSKYRKHNLLIVLALLAGAAGWFWYDGHYNPKFIQEHTLENGKPDSTLYFNQMSPPFMLLGAALLAVRLWMIRDRKVVADDKGLQYDKISIQYDQIESIDKTHFSTKGYFIIHYTEGGQKKELRLSDRGFDNLPAVLDLLVAKITS